MEATTKGRKKVVTKVQNRKQLIQDGFSECGNIFFKVLDDVVIVASALTIHDLDADNFYTMHLSLLRLPYIDPRMHKDITMDLFNAIIRKETGFSREEDVYKFYRQNKFRTTYEKFVGKITKLRTGQSVPYKLAADNDDLEYSHTDLFSNIYHRELREIEEINENEVAVLDLGSGPCFLAALIDHFICHGASPKRVKVLSVEEKDDVYFTGIRELYQGSPPAYLEFHLKNLLEPGWTEGLVSYNGGRLFTMVVVNHVLEHLPGDKAKDEDYISQWLGVTEKKLIVSVPVEEEPDVFSGHFRTYTPDYLKSLGQTVTSSSDFVYDPDEDLISMGILAFSSCSTVTDYTLARRTLPT